MKRNALSVITLMLLAVMLVGALTGCGLDVPRPQVKTGEFNFSVTYELHGEVKTVSGVYVCEYAGVELALDGGYSRSWNEYIKGGMDEHIELGRVGDDVFWLDLDLYPEYFMNDPEWSLIGIPEPRICAVITDSEGTYYEYDTEIIEENYGARVLNYEYDEPIENSFGILK